VGLRTPSFAQADDPEARELWTGAVSEGLRLGAIESPGRPWRGGRRAQYVDHHTAIRVGKGETSWIGSRAPIRNPFQRISARATIRIAVMSADAAIRVSTRALTASTGSRAGCGPSGDVAPRVATSAHFYSSIV